MTFFYSSIVHDDESHRDTRVDNCDVGIYMILYCKYCNNNNDNNTLDGGRNKSSGRGHLCGYLYFPQS